LRERERQTEREERKTDVETEKGHRERRGETDIVRGAERDRH